MHSDISETTESFTAFKQMLQSANVALLLATCSSNLEIQATPKFEDDHSLRMSQLNCRVRNYNIYKI